MVFCEPTILTLADVGPSELLAAEARGQWEYCKTARSVYSLD